MSDIRDLRKEYRRGELHREDLNPDPVEQFRVWLDEALASDLPEPYAVTVATADGSGQPSARTVLLRGVDARGFVFYTNYLSQKGREIEANPRAALLFYWPGLERQVRVEGTVEFVSDAESDAYFASRPRESQLGAHASAQSSVVEDRAELEERLHATERAFPGEVPRPPHWGGYRVRPFALEFWQGRPSRLHDRFRYTLTPDGWTIDRLMP
ncbi:pyridoxamine 5'-phosphate oxidase [Deinococcus pimensis]|uniref:pyridoxamine 5'-phosphate oxidase n=1 Tax=Deinococcus pimensis TaxID=309888 RepID=UPI00047FC9AA|nr:pyridoxamine 5'-phosphate oxidase [Deinococcus pimensis]